MVEERNPIRAPDGVPEEALDPLFRAPIEEFTGERNALAGRLRDQGKRSQSEWVKGLRKPTRAAWLVNQLRARKPAEVKRLLELGAELRARQEELIAGSADREKLREAARREQSSIEALLRTAETLGREHKLGAQIIDKAGETLRAAAGDPELARAIELGRVTREQRASTIGGLGAAAPAPATKPRGRDRTGERQARERRAAEQQARRRKAAERELATAERRLERERSAVERAREALEEREAKLREAERRAAAARRKLDST